MFLKRFTTILKFVEVQNELKDCITLLRCVGIFWLLEQSWKVYNAMRLRDIVSSVSFYRTDEQICFAGLGNDTVKIYVEKESRVLMFSILSNVLLFTIRPPGSRPHVTYSV